MKTEYEKHCLEYASNGGDICDLLHRHFEDWDRWNWTEVIAEGLRMWENMFHEKIDPYSAKGGLIAAIAAQGADGVWCAVAAMMGIGKDDLMTMAYTWYHEQDRRPDPLHPEILKYYLEDKINATGEFAPHAFTGF